MCGIAGYIGNKLIDDGNVRNCLAVMRRRGPDASGAWRGLTPDGRHVLLLHTRLSIIDLDSRSNQPFIFASRVLTYNGEIYNYVELRNDLRERGHVFTTESDTEVLLRQMAEHGDSALEDCEGMWAFACYDGLTGVLTLSRDRFGEKPLYLYDTTDGLYFASEISGILALSGKKIPINRDKIFRYLSLGFRGLHQNRDSFFTGVSELKPGEILTINGDGRWHVRRYWTPAFKADETLSFAQAVEQTREKLIRSVEIRLRADVPLAFYMSGGVDSTSLVAIARNIFKRDVNTFSVLIPDGRYEELDEVNHVVNALGLDHQWISVTPRGFSDNLTKIIRYHHEPLSTIPFYLFWLLLEHIAEKGYKIVMNGSSSDELFTGYYEHHNLYLAEMQNRKEYPAALAAWEKYVRPLVRNPCLQNIDAYLKDPFDTAHNTLNQDEFESFFVNPRHEEFHEIQFTPAPLRNRMLNELFAEITPVFLHEDDLNCMYYSVENRSPFLDRHLAETAFAIPARHLVRNGYAKAVLREALRGLVPDLILDNRKKVGFNAPVMTFLDAENRRWALKDGPLFDMVKRPMVENLLAKPFLPNSESKFLFGLLSIKVFLENFG